MSSLRCLKLYVAIACMTEFYIENCLACSAIAVVESVCHPPFHVREQGQLSWVEMPFRHTSYNYYAQLWHNSLSYGIILNISKQDSPGAPCSMACCLLHGTLNVPVCLFAFMCIRVMFPVPLRDLTSWGGWGGERLLYFDIFTPLFSRTGTHWFTTLFSILPFYPHNHISIRPGSFIYFGIYSLPSLQVGRAAEIWILVHHSN